MPTLTIQEDNELFRPNAGGQTQFMDDYTHRFVALAGGWFAGKTWAGARKLANLHLHNALDAQGHRTFCKGLLVAQNYSLALSVNARELRKAFDEMGLPSRLIKGTRCCVEVPALGTPDQPSEVLVLSAEAPETINSFTVAHAWGDEVARWREDDLDPTNDPLVQLIGRLRDPRAKVQQALFTFTHEGDATKVYRDFEEAPKPGHVLYRAGTFQNPHAAEFAKHTLEQLTPELAHQYLDGIAANLRGSAVYANYLADRNASATLALLPGLPLDVSLDFNIAPGMHGLIGQEWIPAKAEERSQLVDVWELHGPRMSVKGLVKSLRSLLEEVLADLEWTSIRFFGDASGGSAWAGTGESCWDILRDEMDAWGVPYRLMRRESNPHVADRVNALNAAMCNARGEVHYRCHPRCKRLIQDLKYMKWDGNDLEKKDRSMSHASDAAGYRAHWLLPIRRIQRTQGARVVLGTKA